MKGVDSKQLQKKKEKSAKIVHAVIDKDNEVSYQDILENKVTCMYRFIQFNNGVAYFTTWDKSNKFNYHRIDFTNSEDVTTATTSQADYDDEDDEDDED